MLTHRSSASTPTGASSSATSAPGSAPGSAVPGSGGSPDCMQNSTLPYMQQYGSQQSAQLQLPLPQPPAHTQHGYPTHMQQLTSSSTTPSPPHNSLGVPDTPHSHHHHAMHTHAAHPSAAAAQQHAQQGGIAGVHAYGAIMPVHINPYVPSTSTGHGVAYMTYDDAEPSQSFYRAVGPGYMPAVFPDHADDQDEQEPQPQHAQPQGYMLHNIYDENGLYYPNSESTSATPTAISRPVLGATHKLAYAATHSMMQQHQHQQHQQQHLGHSPSQQAIGVPPGLVHHHHRAGFIDPSLVGTGSPSAGRGAIQHRRTARATVNPYVPVSGVSAAARASAHMHKAAAAAAAAAAAVSAQATTAATIAAVTSKMKHSQGALAAGVGHPVAVGFAGPLAIPRKKRDQVKTACVNCRKACKKCSHHRPCSRCVAHGMVDSCIDVPRKDRSLTHKREPKSPERASPVDDAELSPNEQDTDRTSGVARWI
ncbi:hypothetical protein HK105_201901 [Polyrhizophydium stewartii]|uniref:Zn(2)-C6 fungal-type domain-containing protein n=1 Tax=Polyrhizophydium stewartii TaxID=2732419 RepID=A0ABR4NG48_9FUNG